MSHRRLGFAPDPEVYSIFIIVPNIQIKNN